MTTTYNCDCLNNCGDDPWLTDGTGRATPCEHMQARQEQKRQVDLQLAKITELRKVYGAANIYELLDKMHAAVGAAEETVRQLNRALRDAVEGPTFMGEPVRTSLLQAAVKSIADIKVCYCPPDKCQAPVIMGRQVACTRKLHP